MRNFIKPSEEELELLRDAATKNGAVDEREWVKTHCRLVASLLKRDPLRYRGYGPYWYVVKKALLDAGYSYFGDAIDKEWFELVDYGKTFYNLFAAWMYQENAANLGLIYSSDHIASFEEEDESGDIINTEVEYMATDDDMELMALERRIN